LACSVQSSSSSSSSCFVDIGLGVASEWRVELTLSHEGREWVTFRNTSAAQLMVHNKQLGED
jgi:hypothetical protein